MPKTLVKLRRTPCDAPRPASTPPVISASAIRNEEDVEDEEEEGEKIMAELEVFEMHDLLVGLRFYCADP